MCASSASASTPCASGWTPTALAAYKLTTQDAEDAIRRSNLEVPGGRIESTQREFSVTSQTDLTRPSQFSDIIIAECQRLSGAHPRRGRVQEGPG
jgi:multidrug efflux pump